MAIQVDELMKNAKTAEAVFSQMTQVEVDAIVRAVYKAAFKSRIVLAKMAFEETGAGKWEDKVIKNVVASQFIYDDIKDLKTVGVISDDEKSGIIEIAQPIGPIMAIIPMTNPTSTTIFKILISMKTRNSIIISPHRAAAKCTVETARICYEAALEAGAPEFCVQWAEHTSREETHQLMSHKSLALILATGGGGLVNAAYSSGTPALGVGAGNVPVLIGSSADIPFAVENILISKTFDNGTICCSEQAVVVYKDHAEQVLSEFRKRNCAILTPAEVKKLGSVVFDADKKIMNGKIVGKSASYIAKLAGIDVPENTRVLIAPTEGIGFEWPTSAEILAPLLAFFVADDMKQAVKICIKLNFFGGMGHTVSVYSNHNEKIVEFAKEMNAGRVVVNTPSSQGGVGGIFNSLHPSFTLGCGSGGKNITTDNVTARHLLNIQRIAKRRSNERFDRFDKSQYFNENLEVEELERLYNKNY